MTMSTPQTPLTGCNYLHGVSGQFKEQFATLQKKKNELLEKFLAYPTTETHQQLWAGINHLLDKLKEQRAPMREELWNRVGNELMPSWIDLCKGEPDDTPDKIQAKKGYLYQNMSMDVDGRMVFGGDLDCKQNGIPFLPNFLKRVIGNVVLDDHITSLGGIEKIGQELYLGNAEHRDLVAPRLLEVGKDILGEKQGHLFFPLLQKARNIKLDGCSSLSAPILTTLENLQITQSSIQRIEIPQLEKIQNLELMLDGEAHFNNLKEVEQNLSVIQGKDGKQTSFFAPQLKKVDLNLEIDVNTIQLPSLMRINWGARFAGDPHPQLGALEFVGYMLRVDNITDPEVWKQEFGNLKTVGFSFIIANQEIADLIPQMGIDYNGTIEVHS
jgi:hypothetical protein